MLAEVSNQFACLIRMRQTGVSLASQPIYNRNAIVTKNHHRVVRVSDDPGQFCFQYFISKATAPNLSNLSSDIFSSPLLRLQLFRKQRFSRISKSN